MKWKYYPLADNDPRAKKEILKNVEMGASMQHKLNRRLLARLAEASGPMFLIAWESLDLDSVHLYEYATYCGGKHELPGWRSIPWTDSPRWGLIHFLNDFLRTSKEAVVICESPLYTRTNWRPMESRAVYYGEDVYLVLTSEDTNVDLIECTIRESERHWLTGVCSSCADVPLGDIPSETFLDTIVANTAHIFTPAIDGEGYLVWSPVASEGASQR